MTEAKHRLRKEGKYQGGKVAFGYKKDREGNQVKDEHQQKCLEFIRKKRAQGISYRDISSSVREDWGLKISHNAICVILTGRRKL